MIWKYTVSKGPPIRAGALKEMNSPVILFVFHTESFFFLCSYKVYPLNLLYGISGGKGRNCSYICLHNENIVCKVSQ